MNSYSKLSASLAVLLLAACSNSNDSTPSVAAATGKTFNITSQPAPAGSDDATAQMVNAMVTAVPGDTIQFACGFYDLKTTLQLANTENIHIKGCDDNRDHTVLSFRNSPGQVGILAVSVRGLWVENLTVADTTGNGFELRGVDHGYLTNVRAIWSSGRGTSAEKPISKDTYAANDSAILHVACTHPATLNPNVPENQYPGADTTSPDYTVSDLSGRYGIYPVSSDNIWVKHSESVGASDAGIYVGQTNNTIIEDSRAAYNVFGFEIENVQDGEYHHNTAECNTGGFLVYDLDGNLRQYGRRTLMHHNLSRMNNTYNFTHGGFVGNVPPGSGMITLSYDRIDIRDNTFEGNNTAGIIHTSYAIFPPGSQPSDRRLDFYSEGVHIFRNTFTNNGASLPVATTKDLFGQQAADYLTSVGTDFSNYGTLLQAWIAGLPAQDPSDPQAPPQPNPAQPNPDVAHLLPALVGFKNQAACSLPTNFAQCAAVNAAHLQMMATNCPNQDDPTTCMNSATATSEAKFESGFRGAHIVWDGLVDPYDDSCKYPNKANGYSYDVPADSDGKPKWTNQYPNPSCHYNQYKFAADKVTRKKPDWVFSCIDTDGADKNTFSADSLAFANFHGRDGLDAALALTDGNAPSQDEIAAAQTFPSSLDVSTQHCADRMVDLPEVTIPAFVPSASSDVAPTPAEIAALCGKVMPAGQVNFDAARVNCPTLDQYNLFSDPQDPRSAPNGAHGYDTDVPGIPFVLNTKLFSDYAVKYRVLFMPAGTQAIYKDSADGQNATIIFPAGTIIAKTFAFANGSNENVVETRLLIKRVKDNAAHWDGAAYIWTTDDSGKRIAKFSPSGGTADVQWNYADTDPAVHETYQGSTGQYLIPNANQCLSCHSREDSEPGAAPIGLKIRNLNRVYQSESPNSDGHPASAAENQVKWMCDHGYMAGCPTLTVTNGIANVERLPKYNVPGDGNATDPGKDTEARARAYLEVNCQHCHNVRGYAASTGFYLNAIGDIDAAYKICKGPTATGSEGSGGRTIVMYPEHPELSIVEYRLANDISKPAAMMPPLGRTVVHAEGHQLISDWLQNVMKLNDETHYPGSSNCH